MKDPKLIMIAVALAVVVLGAAGWWAYTGSGGTGARQDLTPASAPDAAAVTQPVPGQDEAKPRVAGPSDSGAVPR